MSRSVLMSPAWTMYLKVAVVPDELMNVADLSIEPVSNSNVGVPSVVDTRIDSSKVTVMLIV